MFIKSLTWLRSFFVHATGKNLKIFEKYNHKLELTATMP